MSSKSSRKSLFPLSFSLSIVSFLFLFSCANLSAQKGNKINTADSPTNVNQRRPEKTRVRSGPMVGYSEMKEVMLWVQTTSAAKVQILYKERIEGAMPFYSDVVTTKKERAFTAHILCDQVQPGTVYDYELFLNDQKVKFDYELSFQTQKIWQYRTDPPPVKFSFGSCLYVNEKSTDRPGEPYGSNFEVLESIHKTDPDFMVWVGDNTYMREADWNSRTGMIHRYSHTRELPELQPLLGSTHNYAVWDDHDYGPNDSDRGFYLKDVSKEVFDLFWANQTSGIPGKGGVTSKFSWADLDFFMMDNRYFRAPNKRKTGDRVMFGKKQMEWLIDNLIASKASFKFVCVGGQILNDVAVFENYINVYPEEREKLLKTIEKENLRNVVFLTGDRHHTEMDVWKPQTSKPVYEITSSPLTAKAYDVADEKNTLRMEGTHVAESNFVNVEVTGPRKNRKMSVSCYNSRGKVLWTKEVNQE